MSVVHLVTSHDMFHISFSGQNHSQHFFQEQSISHIIFKNLFAVFVLSYTSEKLFLHKNIISTYSEYAILYIFVC